MSQVLDLDGHLDFIAGSLQTAVDGTVIEFGVYGNEAQDIMGDQILDLLARFDRPVSLDRIEHGDEDERFTFRITFLDSGPVPGSLYRSRLGRFIELVEALGLMRHEEILLTDPDEVIDGLERIARDPGETVARTYCADEALDLWRDLYR